jgi:hypothetical protein
VIRRLKPIEPDDANLVLRKLETMATDLAQIANIIGPSFGAKWCDKGLRLIREVESLHRQIEDELWRLGLYRTVTEPRPDAGAAP